jgi:hypothetical protein
MFRGTPNRPDPSPVQNSPIPAWAGVALCLLLAVAQIALGGYQLGFGNQAIQIAFLKHGAYPWMYASDPMVVQTLPEYPSFFFRVLAPLLRFTSVESLYLVLQIATGFATLTCVYWLARSIFRTHTSAIVAVALLVGGHLQALAGDTLYSRGFTHTYAALPLAIAALALAYRGRFVAACAVAGVLFNIHALTAAYALLMIGAAKLADLREQRPVEWLVRGLLAGATFFALASPTLAMMAGQHQTFDAEWINLTRIRSADHSFASTWWTSGDPGVPRFLMIFALFVLSLSFPPWRRGEEAGGLSGRGRWGGARRGTRITLLMTAAVIAFFAAGYIFTEWHPVPLVIRLQPFRASRLLLILMLVHIAHGAAAAIRGGLARRPERGGDTADEDWNRPLPARIADVCAGVLVLATLLIPSFLPLLPVTLLAAVIAALIAGHLSWQQAVLCAAVLQLVLLAALRIDFPLVAGARELFSSGAAAQGEIRTLAISAILIAGIAALLLSLTRERRMRGVVIGLTLAVGAYFSFSLYHRERLEDAGAEQAQLEGAAAWARSQTSPNSVFLTALPNFRVAGERAIVGTWRDGTQVYFSANYGPEWRERAMAVEPGLELTADGTALLSHGKPLETLDDRSLVKIAEQYNAHYILLRTPPRPRLLTVAYADDHFTVYEPQIEMPPVPAGVFDPNLWVESETFMTTTVQENIAKHRMANLTLQVADASGRPVQNLPIRLEQNRAAFGFGVSLGFFEPNGLSANGDLKPPTVRPIELEKLPEIFNASMIAFSSKWQYIEPTRGNYNWSDLDKYVDYGVKNNLDLEFHHLTGILPSWVESMGGVDGQTGLNFPAPIPRVQDEFNRHCFDTVARYADRIKYWQVVNEKYMMQYVPPVFKVLKEKYPNNQFGLSDCVKFFDNTSAGGGRGMGRNNVQYKGADAVDWLISKGIQPDFFSVHGHYPLGLWADPQEMYNVFDYFAERKVRVHITEEYLQLGGQMYGPMRSGTWTPELQADYLSRFMAVCFSHPNVDMANLWGLAPNGWGASDSGLIDANSRTRPAWDELKRLITQTWRSNVASELSLDGSTLQHVYHGNYTATITLPDGRKATADFDVPETEAATIRLRLDGNQGSLQVVK